MVSVFSARVKDEFGGGSVAERRPAIVGKSELWFSQVGLAR
jgi:hypothetical protein